jgi:hypothetical protein
MISSRLVRLITTATLLGGGCIAGVLRAGVPFNADRQFQEGGNLVETEGESGGRIVRDTCTGSYRPKVSESAKPER